MELQWQLVSEHEVEKVNLFAEELNSSPILATVLLNRGIDDIHSARSFFKPDLKKLHDPFLMAGMSTAIDRIRTAVDHKQKILVYGDYDVDGTTATSMLLLFFRYLGAQVDFYVPDRIIEGYGLSEKGIRWARQNGVELIISVDCGITAFEEINLARSLGMDVIVCDHHQPASELPVATAVLNPKRFDCHYPFKELAGVGVAFKLLQGLQQSLRTDETQLVEYLELVAIGSAADIVPLLDENRIFAKIGLRSLSKTRNFGLKALLEVTGLMGREINTGQVVFVIAPRINAVGRLGDAGRAVRLLTTESKQQATNIASILERENRNRKTIDEEMLTQALELIESNLDPDNEHVFVLDNDGWHPGVIGIVASRIVEKYFRPTIMIATADGQGRGSARSIPGFDIYEALKSCEDLMVNFGGHKYAAGLTITSENIPTLKKKISQVAAEKLTAEMRSPKLWIDAEVQFHELDGHLIKLLNRMAPFGPQNMRPVFLTRGLQIVGTPRVVGKNHLKFKVRQKDIVMDAIGYDLGDLLYRIAPGEKNVEMVYVLDENEWQGRKTMQLRVKDLR